MMHLNLAPGIDYVTISIVRPLRVCSVREDDQIPRPDDSLITFSRAEYALLVVSGLYAALRAPRGWKDWEEATVHRAHSISEKDHLLCIASLLSQGRDLGLPGHGRHLLASRAMQRLSERAALWRAQEGISTPLTVFPDGAVSWAANPQPVVQAPINGGLFNFIGQAVDQTHIETLIDLAKHGEEATFKELARMLGVAADQVDELWTGTIRRVKR
jgi:hypothetical protein